MLNIPLFLSADNNYAPFVATTIASVCDHTKEFVDVYVLDGGITPKNRQKIENLKNKFNNFSLEFLNIDVEKEFPNLIERMHFTKSMYSRFLIPYLKPDLKKVLYSDVDVIALGDIKEMYNEDLEDYVIAAVWEKFNEDNGNNNKRKRDLNLSSEHKYFASGNLIIDTQKWREEDITPKLLEIGQKYQDVLQFLDQDILNIYFDNNYKVLTDVYGFQTKGNVEAPENVIIRHFQSAFKPWQLAPDFETKLMPNSKDFWYYAQMTDFFDELVSKVKYHSMKDLMMELLKNKRNS